MTAAKPVDQLTGNLSKPQIEAREMAQNLIVTNGTKPTMNDIVKNNPVMKKTFNKLKKLSDLFTDADSKDLNTMTFNLYLKAEQERKLIAIDESIELNENYDHILNRLEKLDKKIDTASKNLGLTLTQRLRMSSDLAKLYLEQQKLNATSQPQQQENPLMELLKRNTGQEV
ncbi:hypothetical protein [Bacillus sp. B3-WWTP-C-10-D-3]|uniref:hypothetical protein n=1 Tax=Bacillus sp. B3-WWTP-C-10-D-3 TaxID=2653217 RepID=UPI0012617346|nr:hypothetical protein [Bacillus sp. B3-WWTP-C-10-D-3]KAB7640283.1 hypothetical protein GBN83_09265 [Bacillus sp. B3-WWTP-C-10-D-3]